MNIASTKIYLASVQSIFQHPTWDVVLLVALFAISVFYGFWAGRRRIISAIIYTYVTLALLSAIPISTLQRFFGIRDEYGVRIALFAAIFILLFFLLGRGKVIGFPAARSVWQTFFLSFAQLGLLFHIILWLLPPAKAKLLAPLTRALFANPDYHIWWLLVPLGVLIFVRRLEAKEDW
ncbi:MAG: hypothetical protein G01um101433_30 [Parcubacteria group bacterium Gr01-1014_33]|nr:MAG: hypothetical protein G01um101433_30 [Parcubacteria group bacterium Gr01-1014_33]